MIASHGITSANTKSVQDASVLPSMRTTILGWFRTLTLTRVTKVLVDREVKEIERTEFCRGVLQPFTAQMLRMKPEGERAWVWQMLHTTPDVNLRPDEIFSARGLRYRVMEKKDYSDYGYVTYDVVQDYRKGAL